MTTLILHPENKEQLSVFKTIAKALKVQYEENTTPLFMEELKEAVHEMNLIKEGKLRGKPLNELLSNV